MNEVLQAYLIHCALQCERAARLSTDRHLLESGTAGAMLECAETWSFLAFQAISDEVSQ